MKEPERARLTVRKAVPLLTIPTVVDMVFARYRLGDRWWGVRSPGIVVPRGVSPPGGRRGRCTIGEIGANLGAEATVIPAADLEFEVGAGKITTVTLAEIALTKPTADIVLSGVELNISNAVGPISVRPYAKISVTTDTGVYVYYAHGPTQRI